MRSTDDERTTTLLSNWRPGGCWNWLKRLKKICSNNMLPKQNMWRLGVKVLFSFVAEILPKSQLWLKGELYCVISQGPWALSSYHTHEHDILRVLGNIFLKNYTNVYPNSKMNWSGFVWKLEGHDHCERIFVYLCILGKKWGLVSSLALPHT